MDGVNEPMQTVLTDAESEALIERIARWATSLEIGGIVAFLLEVNRPVAPLTGNTCIAFGSFAQGLIPFPVHALGLLLQDDRSVLRLRERILKLQREEPAHAVPPEGALGVGKT